LYDGRILIKLFNGGGEEQIVIIPAGDGNTQDFTFQNVTIGPDDTVTLVAYYEQQLFDLAAGEASITTIPPTSTQIGDALTVGVTEYADECSLSVLKNAFTIEGCCGEAISILDPVPPAWTPCIVKNDASFVSVSKDYTTHTKYDWAEELNASFSDEGLSFGELVLDLTNGQLACQSGYDRFNMVFYTNVPYCASTITLVSAMGVDELANAITTTSFNVTSINVTSPCNKC
jgi:hypothetical protein